MFLALALSLLLTNDADPRLVPYAVTPPRGLSATRPTISSSPQAGEPYVKLPEKVTGAAGHFIRISAETNGLSVSWLSIDPNLDMFPPDLLKDTKTAVFVGSVPGTYQVFAVTAKGDQVSRFAVCQVIVTGVTPPKPPDPPDPKPPDPKPPIPVAGFRVLVVYESSNPVNTAKIMGAKTVRDYLNSKCAVGKDNKTPEWRVLDKDVPMGNTEKHWQDLMARPRSGLPWIIISTGTSGYEGPLPATADETLALLKKWGG